MLKQWQQKHTAFALTSRAPDTLFPTLRELKRNGIDFSSSALRKKEDTLPPFEKGKLKRSWLYSQGVFFSSGQDKGVIQMCIRDSFTNNDWLACLLRWADMQPYANYKGPTTEQIVKALKEGRPTNTIGRIGTSSRQAPNVGTTNGAGMRVAPAGCLLYTSRCV